MRRAFTVVELLIVIGIIVLMLALAVPAFNLLMGSRGEQATANQIAALIARSRQNALRGVDDYSGVLFYRTPADGRKWATFVNSSRDDLIALPAFPELWLDTDGSETVEIAAGIEFPDDAVTIGAARQDDGYTGFNSGRGLVVQYGRPVLFDRRGILVSKSVGFHARRAVKPDGSQFRLTRMGALLYGANFNQVISAADPRVNLSPTPANAQESKIYRSALGFVLFDESAFLDQFDYADPQVAGAAYGAERAEELWLDANADPILVNRYTGALVK